MVLLSNENFEEMFCLWINLFKSGSSAFELLTFKRGEHLGESSFLKSEDLRSGELVPDSTVESCLKGLCKEGERFIGMEDFFEWDDRVR